MWLNTYVLSLLDINCSSYLDLSSPSIAYTADFPLSESTPTDLTARTPVVHLPSVKEEINEM